MGSPGHVCDKVRRREADFFGRKNVGRPDFVGPDFRRATEPGTTATGRLDQVEPVVRSPDLLRGPRAETENVRTDRSHEQAENRNLEIGSNRKRI